MIKQILLIASLLSLFISCKEDETTEAVTETVDWFDLDNFYVHLNFEGTNYFLEATNYQVEQGEDKSGCADGYAYGIRHTDWIAAEREATFIKSLSLGITSKVPITELGEPEEFVPGIYRSFTPDSLTYMREVLHNSLGRRPIGFPLSLEGYPLTNLDINGDTFAEAYLRFSTESGQSYYSTSNETSVRADSTYFHILRSFNLGDSAPKEYSYIVEGEFKIDMFHEDSKTDTKLVEGIFRLPLYTYYTTEVLQQCK